MSLRHGCRRSPAALPTLALHTLSLLPVLQVKIQVQVGFGSIIRKGAIQELEIEALPTDSVRDCKEKVATAAGGAVSADDLLLMFGAAQGGCAGCGSAEEEEKF